MDFNFIGKLVLWSPICFGRSCGHLQGDFFEDKNTILIKVYLKNSKVLNYIQFLIKIHC